MNKVEALLNRIELVAKRLEMSVDDALMVLEGRHPTHAVVQKYKEVEVPTMGGAVVNSPVSSAMESSSVSGGISPSDQTSSASAENPTTSGNAVASAGDQESSAVSTEAVLPTIDEAAAQNQSAAESAPPHNED